MNNQKLSAGVKKLFSEYLLKWWEENKRTYPWRQTRDPYAVLIAEMLLRKTTAKQVEGLYNKFIMKFPTPKSLYNAEKRELADFLKPLGMEHKRAELFVKLGKDLMGNFNGKVPSSPKMLLQLPGVGQYATNAVLSLSYGLDVPMVDTNFIRVIKRVFSITPSKIRARNDEKIWEFAEGLIPKNKSREFNFAVLDFAALVCRPRNPACMECPVASICKFYNNKNLEAEE